MEREYFLHTGQQRLGPFTLDAIRAAPPAGVTHVWYAGLEGWLPLDQVPELRDVLRSAAPPNFPPPPPTAPQEVIFTATPVAMQHSPLADAIDRLYRGLTLYLTLFIVTLILTLVLGIGFAVAGEEEAGAAIGLLGGLITLVFAVIFTVHWCKLHYRFWEVAIDRSGFNDHTPGMAVGLLFVPVFNFYWVFPSYLRLSELLNSILARGTYAARRPMVNTGNTTAMCVLNIIGLIPYLGLLTGFINIFIWMSMYGQHRRAVTFILRAGG